MRIHIGVSPLLVLSAILASAHAQIKPPGTTPVRSPEIALSYDLIGSNAPAGQCGCFFLNGGSASAAFPVFVKPISIVGEFSASHAGNINRTNYDLTLMTYLAGVRYTIHTKHERLSLFGQGLIGGAHASGSLIEAPNPGSGNAQITLAGSIGGGIDIRWKQLLSVRALEVDYRPTTFDNHTTALENNYRISAGIVLYLHR